MVFPFPEKRIPLSLDDGRDGGRIETVFREVIPVPPVENQAGNDGRPVARLGHARKDFSGYRAVDGRDACLSFVGSGHDSVGMFGQEPFYQNWP